MLSDLPLDALVATFVKRADALRVADDTERNAIIMRAHRTLDEVWEEIRRRGPAGWQALLPLVETPRHPMAARCAAWKLITVDRAVYRPVLERLHAATTEDWFRDFLETTLRRDELDHAPQPPRQALPRRQEPVRPRPDAATVKRLLAERLAPELAARAQRLVRPSIVIDAAIAEAPVPVGRSKIGGDADLPPDAAWPMQAGKPMLFLAQFDFAELSGPSGGEAFPKSGLLQFFADDQDAQIESEFAPGIRYWTAADGPLVRRASPFRSDRGAPFLEHRLRLSAEPSLPFFDARVMAQLYSTKAERLAYADLWTDLYPGDAHIHRLLGWPHLIQGDFLEPESTVDPDAPALLFQLGSLYDHARDFERIWGDGGYLYFVMTPAALARRQFQRIDCIFQCY